MKLKHRSIARRAAALLLTAALCACGNSAAPANAGGRGGAGGGAGEKKTSAISVNVFYPETQTLERETEFVGKIEASQSVKVYPEVSGTVSATYFNAGDTVVQGQLLFEIDSEDAETSLKQAQLSYQKTLADLESEENGSANVLTELQYQNDIKSAENRYRQAHDALSASDDAEDLNFSQMRKLRQEYKEAEEAWSNDQTEANYSAMQAAEKKYDDFLDDYNLKKTNTVSFENAYDDYLDAIKKYEIYKSMINQEDTTTREIEREQAELTLQNAQKTYDKHKIYAPATGIIATKSVESFDVVNTGTCAYTISQEGVQCVTFNLSEDAVDAMEIGYEVTVNYNGKNFTARVTELSPEADSSTGLYPAKAQFAEEIGTTRSGAVIKVTAITAQENDAITVPIDYVYYDGNQPYVYIYENDTAKRVDVTLGMSTYDTVSVTDGLSASDAVISTWHPNLKDGAAVHNDEIAGETDAFGITDAYSPENSQPEEAPEKKEG